ncbi:Hypp3112 [Branchiostoma lanceolatum]|uniref:Hypp3112 protein n=1 Tax=Branchiostoma lanceolatum TaxID=7740 RepID=A0A8K0A1T4_BRALA|nr:Hypp3112 [Branchiostoma lanceolatum]
MATEDRTPPVMCVLGFSMETTLALLPRMYMEELQSELERRSIEVKLAGVDRPRGRDDLEHVLREVMTREYEEAEGDEGMDMSDTSSTFEPGCGNTSSAFEHGSWLLQVGSSKPILINDQATSQNVQKLSQPTEKEGMCSRQAADIHVHVNVSQAPSTGQIQVKKEPINRDFEQYSNSVARMTEPSTSQTNHPDACIGEGSQPNSASSQGLMVRIKTEPGMEEETEDEQQDMRREHCPSSPGELSQELDMVTVCKEEEEGGEPSTEEPVKGKRTRCVPIRPKEQLPAVEADRHSEGAQSNSITQRSHRFATLNEQQLDELEDGRVEKTTERATKWGVNLFKAWLQARDLNTAFEELPPPDLALLLRQFYGEVRKDDGTPYSKSTYGCLRAAIHRHLTGRPYHCKYNILKDKEFQAANSLYMGVLKQLKRDGMDTTKAYPPILACDISRMFQTKTLSVDDPVSLQRLVYFYLVFFLCRRGDNLRNFKTSDFVANTDEGRKYYTLRNNEHPTSHSTPRLYASSSDTRPCPVQALELYLSKLQDGCPFLFQRPNPMWNPESSALWYCNQPVGHNKLGRMMRDISRAAGLSKAYTNHSVRVTAIQALDGLKQGL